jgi:dephospho-CoA kinase
MRRRLVIGLTGNIATGKSEVGRILAGLGAHVIDADRVAHEAMQSGGPAYDAVIGAFGPGVVAPDGEIDRARLGAIVFRDQGALKRLEAIVHPTVIAEVDRQIAEAGAGVVVVEAIKLIEAGMHRRYAELWVVTAPRSAQIARLVQTRRLTEEEASLRVDAQSPQDAKAAQADCTIVNDGDVRALRRKVETEWARLLSCTVAIRAARRGDREDAAGTADVLNSVIEERRYTAIAGHWTPEAELAYIDGLGPRSELFVAEVAGRVVGLQSIEPFASYPSAMEHVAQLGTQILAEYRGHGIGRRLAGASLEFAREHGYEKIVIYVLSDNPLGMAYYRSLGFEGRGTLQRQSKIDGVYHDEVLMEMHL